MDYWKYKTSNQKHAQEVIDYCKVHYAADTETSIAGMTLFPHTETVPQPADLKNKLGSIRIGRMTSVDALYQGCDLSRKMCVVNFASYKNPGGAFLEGSMSQEEALCHESNLYNILSSQKAAKLFYDEHKKKGMLNRALYHSDLLYIPQVVFNRQGRELKADVITCAAPNKKAAQMYQNVSDQEVNAVLAHRIDAVLYAASQMDVDDLVLGAFGCGVFGNDAYVVAILFMNALQGKYAGQFHNVLFPVPDDKNHAIMSKVILGAQERK